jgi:ATP synthase protein I
MLRVAVIPIVATAPVVVAVFGVTRGARGGLAALLGVCIAVVFFAGGLHVMSRLTNANPISLLTGAIAVYLGQVLFLGVVILTFSSADWLDGMAFGLSVLAVALIWQVIQIVAFLRLRKPVYDDPVVDQATGATGPAVKPAVTPIDERADETVQRRLG